MLLATGGILGPRAEVVVLTPAADTTLVEAAPTNNLGRMAFVNAGTTQILTQNRGLFRFELDGQVPPGASVTRAEFIVEVVGRPRDGFAAASFGVHRLLQSWGEGDKTAEDPGLPGVGAPATSGDATWLHRFALTTNTWEQPGGASGRDFTPGPSAEATIYGLEDSPYTFGSTPALVADVQAWVDDPGRNFGWMLLCQAEATGFTARRFASREDAPRAPLLRVEFHPPPRIEYAAAVGSSLLLQFTARAGQVYVVESRDRLLEGSPWLELTNVPAPQVTTPITVIDLGPPTERFYRLRLP